MKPPLILVGVIHRDPQGPQRLGPLLAGLEAGVLSVQVSAHALAWRRRQGPGLLARLEANLPLAARLAGLDLAQARVHPALAALGAYLLPPSEWTLARAWARARGIPCLAADLSGLSRRLLARAPGLIEPANITSPI